MTPSMDEYMVDDRLRGDIGQHITFFLMVEDVLQRFGLTYIEGRDSELPREIRRTLDAIAESGRPAPRAQVEKLASDLRLWITNMIGCISSLEWLRVEFLGYIQADHRQVEAGGRSDTERPE